MLLMGIFFSVSMNAFEVEDIAYQITSYTDMTVQVISKSDKYRGDVAIPESITSNDKKYTVTTISSSAFSGCSDLNSITIPNSVTTIGNSAFSGCSGLSVKIYDLSAWCRISFSNLTSNPLYSYGHLYINGQEVKELIIPKDITEIKSFAFNGCSGLTSVTIPNGVTSVGSSAFYGCERLKSAIIPNSVTSIGNSAFEDCSGLTSITIPNIVTSIGSSAFAYCSNLTSITIPNSVTSISSSAFYKCSNLTSITIPNSVTSIGNSAFYGCSGLTSITIPNSVNSIGESAFGGRSGLAFINVEEGNKIYDSRDNCNAIIETETNTLRVGCKNTTIPNSVTSIGNSAFYGCSGLTSITIPNSVNSIGNHAFLDCWGLTTVKVKWDKPLVISHEVFTDNAISTFKLTDVILYVPKGSKADYKGNSVWSSFGKIVEMTESDHFEVTITSTKEMTVQVISNPNGYNGDVVIPETITYNDKQYTVTSIGSYAFSDCNSLNSIIIPNSVTTIGIYAFSYCSGLTSVTIPNSVTSISPYVFYQCEGLKSITIPNSVTSIGESAFHGCSGLNSLTIPSSVIYISESAFQSCSCLTSLTIPNSVSYIGEWAFNNCSGLKSVKVGWKEPLIVPSSTFGDIHKQNVTLYVPKGSKAAYATSDVWKDFGNIVEDESLGIGNVHYDPYGGKLTEIYTVNGVKVNTKDIKTLPKGIYIQGRKKFFKK